MECVQVGSHLGGQSDNRIGNVLPFRRPGALPAGSAMARRRGEQRSLMDAVYATGSLTVAAADRDTKLTASRLQVYGFLSIEELGADGTARRLRPSEAVRAGSDRPWRLTKASYGGLSVTIPAADAFLFEAPGRPATDA